MAYTTSGTPAYYAEWSFNVKITSVTVNGLSATVYYEVYTIRNGTSYKERYNNWCKVYVDTWKDSISASPTPTHSDSVSGTKWGSGWVYDKKLFSGSKAVSLDSKTGEGSLRIVAVGAFGSTYTGQTSFGCYHDCLVSITGGWSNVTAGTVEIKDSGNNTFTIVGTKGTIGTNNAINKSIIEWTVYDNNGIWWKVGGKYPRTEFTGDSYTLGPLHLSSYGGLSTAATRKVAANILTDGELNDVSWPGSPNYFIYEDINQYIAPTNPSNVRLEYSKNRLTIKERWILKWDAAKEKNSISPVKGYRIRMVVNGNYRPIFNAYNQQLSSQDGTDYYYDTENTLTSLDIWPGIHKINPGDNVKFSVFAYSKNANGEITWSVGENKYSLWSGSGISPAESPDFEVENAGVAHVKIGGEWKEGIVHVKVDGQWREADVISTKVNGKWLESE